MAKDLTDEDIVKQLDASQRLERDDNNNAIAGRETGRMARFGAKSQSERMAKERKAERVFRDALDHLLQDREYRVLYEELGERLSDAETYADKAMADIQTALLALTDQITDMEDRAAKTLNGTIVFRTTDGRVVGTDGQEIALEIAEGIQWPADAPSAETYFGAIDQRQELSTSLNEWQNYRNDTLGGIRNRYDDRDNPMSKDDMKDALDALDASRPEAISFEVSTASEEAKISTTPVAFPTIGG